MNFLITNHRLSSFYIEVSIIRFSESMSYSNISSEERIKILEYYKQGVKVNQIGSLLWVDFGKNRRSSTVKKVIKDAGL
ncbi:MAG: hypothetical protein RTU63_11465 [Candidatus Thorarchaeota archaeon]